jgi:gliding motility-associated-like protein
MDLKRILILFLLIYAFADKINGQIYAPAAKDSFAPTYNPPGGTDMVYVFNKPVYQKNITASIIAVSVDRTTGWNFQWSLYNKISQLYEPLSGSESGWLSEIDTITVSSGYQVVMSKGVSNYVFRVWIIVNDFTVSITNKDVENKLLFGYYNCSSLDLRADTLLVPLFYYNPETKARINVYNNYTIRWRTDNEEASTPASKLITRVNDPPSSDTWYFLTLTDRFGLIRTDSVFYESIQSDAKLTGNYINLSDSIEYPGKKYKYFYNDGLSSEEYRSAPGKYRFNFSESKNAVSYKIDFGDGEEFVSTSDSLEVVHEYQEPGNYKVVLTTKSDPPFECSDSMSMDAKLVYAGFSLPNVFSPNNDGDNDLLTLYDNNNVFRSGDVSVVTIDITIFDRAGHKMHTYAGNIRDWNGWDGRVMNSNREAPEGVYFYVISFLYAFEDDIKPIGNEVLKGFFHLYREQ